MKVTAGGHNILLFSNVLLIVVSLHNYVPQVLPVVLYFSFCVSILYYYGIMQWVVVKLGWLLQVTVGTTAAESVNAAANIFLGQVLSE